MRGLLVGCLCSLIIGLLGPWAIYVIRGSYMALDYSTPAAIALFFLLALANRWLHLTKKDLVVAYTMMIVACVVPTGGVVAPVLALATGPIYYATTENKWAMLVGQYLPEWAAPDMLAVEGLYEGGTLIWAEWLGPIFFWLLLGLALYLVMVSSMVLLRKQWVENERLNYPLTALPLALIDGSVQRNGRFWMGFMVPVLVGSWVGLSYYYPTVPPPILDFGSSVIPLKISFPAIGFFYLVSLPMSLSLWVFTFLGEFMHKGFVVLGLPATMEAMPYGADSVFAMYLGAGALLSLVFIRLRFARAHLTELWHSEHRQFVLLGVGLLGIALWLLGAGMPIHVVLVFVPISIAIFLGMTRVVAETGLAVAGAPAIAPVLVMGLLGKGAIGARGIANLAQAFAWTAESTRTSVMASVAHSLKVMTHHRLDLDMRHIWQYAGWAIVIAGAAALWFTITRGCDAGLGTNWWFDDCVRYTYSWAADWNAHTYRPSITGWLLVGGGWLLYQVLSMRYLLGALGAIHPIGLTVMGTFFMRHTWLSCFGAWLIKSGVVRYFGARGYESAKPVFLGLIAGQYMVNLVWLMIDRLTGHTGNVIFWF